MLVLLGWRINESIVNAILSYFYTLLLHYHCAKKHFLKIIENRCWGHWSRRTAPTRWFDWHCKICNTENFDVFGSEETAYLVESSDNDSTPALEKILPAAPNNAIFTGYRVRTYQSVSVREWWCPECADTIKHVLCWRWEVDVLWKFCLTHF